MFEFRSVAVHYGLWAKSMQLSPLKGNLFGGPSCKQDLTNPPVGTFITGKIEEYTKSYDCSVQLVDSAEKCALCSALPPSVSPTIMGGKWLSVTQLLPEEMLQMQVVHE